MELYMILEDGVGGDISLSRGGKVFNHKMLQFGAF